MPATTEHKAEIVKASVGRPPDFVLGRFECCRARRDQRRLARRARKRISEGKWFGVRGGRQANGDAYEPCFAHVICSEIRGNAREREGARKRA